MPPAMPSYFDAVVLRAQTEVQADFLQDYQLCLFDLAVGLSNGDHVHKGFLGISLDVLHVGQLALDRQAADLEVGIELRGEAVDGVGNLYVQFEDNETNTRVPGTFTGLLFPVARYANLRNLVEAIHEPTGYDIATERWETANGRNNPGFLKAVLQHLLP